MSRLNATIAVPGSKSISNRALLLAALAKGTSHLTGLLNSDDTHACLKALQVLGVPVTFDRTTECSVQGVEQFRDERVIQCQDAGTVSRFLIPICAALGGQFRFEGSARLSERPIAPLLEQLIQQGVQVQFLNQAGQLPILIKSVGLKGGRVDLESRDSSQFVSGMLLAAPFAHTPISLYAEGILNKPYIAMTRQMMQDFGVKVCLTQDQEGLYVEPQRYQACEYQIEPDASTASYFFAATMLLGGQVSVKGMSFSMMQGDIRFLSLLEKMGAQIQEERGGITLVAPSKLKGLGEVNMSGFTDTFMTLAALLPFADGPTRIRGLAHTRLQESDRIAAMHEGLSRLGARVEMDEDSLLVWPSALQGASVSSHEDHRVAMSLALIGLRIPGVVIEGSECVKKTCPEYFQLLAQLISQREEG